MTAVTADRTPTGEEPHTIANWRRPARRAGRIACTAALVGIALLVGVRLAGLDSGTYLALAIAGLPYATVGTAALLAALLALRLRRLALIAAALLLTQLVWSAPHFIPDGVEVPASAPRLRIATSNTHIGGIDPQSMTKLVRSARLDVLALEELTTDGARALDDAGLRELLPYRELHPEIDSSIYSRLPLSGGGLLDRPTEWPQTTADVVIGGRTVRFIAVHTFYPAGDPRQWTRDMDALRAEAVSGGTDLVMLGDFNATLDHAPMRALLSAGLTDTHAELGQGWSPTWPVRTTLPPVIQIDHILHGSGLVAVSAHEYSLPGSDHRVVVAELALR